MLHKYSRVMLALALLPTLLCAQQTDSNQRHIDSLRIADELRAVDSLRTLVLRLRKELDSLYAPVNAKALQGNHGDPTISQTHYKLSTEGQLASGNVNRLVWLSRGNVEFTNNFISLESMASYLYGESFGIRSESDFLARSFLRLFRQRRLHADLQNMFETSLRRSLNFREQYGIGLGYYFWRTEQKKLKANLTLLYERSDFKNLLFEGDSAATNIRQVLRLALRLRGQYSLLRQHVRLLHELWLQPALTTTNDVRASANVVLELPLGKRLALRSSLDYTYESVVLLGRKRSDVFWTFGISWGN